MKFSNSKQFLSMLIALIVVSIFFAIPVSAHNYGASVKANGQLYAGTVTAGSSSSTVGGSSFEVGVNSNGSASGFANSAGGGTASAGGDVTKNGVTTYTANTSTSSGDAKSHIKGSAFGTGSAAQGTDVASQSFGTFGKFGAGVSGNVSVGH
jgi:hypothetical protein